MTDERQKSDPNAGERVSARFRPRLLAMLDQIAEWRECSRADVLRWLTPLGHAEEEVRREARAARLRRIDESERAT